MTHPGKSMTRFAKGASSGETPAIQPDFCGTNLPSLTSIAGGHRSSQAGTSALQPNFQWRDAAETFRQGPLRHSPIFRRLA